MGYGQTDSGFLALFSGKDAEEAELLFGFLPDHSWQIRRNGQPCDCGSPDSDAVGLARFLTLAGKKPPRVFSDAPTSKAS